MNVLYAVSEIFPMIKTGGLADVAGALPSALTETGVSIKILVPGYPQVLEKMGKTSDPLFICDISDPLFPGRTRLLEGKLPDGSSNPPDVWVVENSSLFERDGGPYNDIYGHDWHDNAIRFGAFSRAAAILSTADSPAGWIPSILHLNDWQTGLAAAYLHYLPSDSKARTVLTIHNIAYTGIFDRYWLGPLNLPPESFSMYGVEFFGSISFLKAGIFFSNAITTVSPTHAWEIQTPEGGHGLHGLLATRRNDLTGILNGADYKTWNPAEDPFLEQHYGPRNLTRKEDNKTALRKETGLSEDHPGPLFGMVSRLNRDKGTDLIIDGLPAILEEGQLVVLGSGDPEMELSFRKKAEKYPVRIAARTGYDETLAHRIIAGSDFFLMPSRMEPCGLTQMYAMRYGTLPIVRKVGGLADSLENIPEDQDGSGKTPNAGTGIVFEDPSPAALSHAVKRAGSLYRNQRSMNSARKRAMSKDFSWTQSALRYRDLYETLLHKKH